MSRHPKASNLWLQEDTVLLHNSDQIAYPVGKNKDSYSIVTYIYVNTIDDSIKSMRSEVRKNYFGKDAKLLEGTFSECYKFIEDIVLKEQ